MLCLTKTKPNPSLKSDSHLPKKTILFASMKAP